MSALACVSTSVAAMFAVPIGYGQWQLWRRPTTTTAAVIATQTFYDSRDNTPTGHAVRYQFAIGNVTYGFRGPAGNEWAYVPKQDMDTAARTRRISIAYLVEDPWNNRPAVKMRWIALWAVGLMAGPIVLLAVAWVWVGRVIRRELFSRADR